MRTVGLLFSQPQFRFQSTRILIASRFSPWSTSSFCWVDTVVDSYKPGGLNTAINATHPCAYHNGFLASSEIFLVARGNMVFEYFSGGRNHGMGIGRRGVLRRELHASRVWIHLVRTGLGRGGIVRRPRSSVANMAFGPSACKRITNPAASATRTTDSEDRPERSGAESSGG